MVAKVQTSSGRPTVGLIVDTTDTYGRSIFRGVMRYANLQRRWLVFKDYHHLAEINGKWPPLDGAIVAGATEKVFEQVLGITSKVVYCSGGADSKVCPVASLDDHKIGQLGADHLIECNLEHFAFYGNVDGYRTAQQRFAGFKSRLTEKKYQCLESPLTKPQSYEVVVHEKRPILIEWLKSLPKPVGIMCFDDTVASEVCEACLEADIRVPDEVAIIGVNNDDLLCESAWPPLSSVETDHARVGFTAAQMLDRMLSGQKLTGGDRHIRLPPIRVIQRQSSNILTIKDRNLADAVRYIREHACDPCSVSDILKIIPVGRRWLEREFSTQLGRTIHDEITQTRIKTACRLILESDLNIDEIASRCGYSSIKSFYLAFDKHVGQTPAAYRKNTRSSKT